MSVLLENLESPDFDNFLSKTQKCSYPSKSLIFSEGKVPDKLYFVLSGSLGVVLTDDNDKESIIAYLSSGDFFGEMSLFDIDMNRSASIHTKESTVLAEINYKNFKSYADDTLSVR